MKYNQIVNYYCIISTQMFLGRNNVDDTDCFVEKQPVNGGSEAVVKIPIKSNSTSAPVLARVSGERVSIVCRTSTFGYLLRF